jgi:ABC-type sugar transport system substrate-binding protein
MALFLNITDAMVELEPILNIKITDYCANSDIDELIQNIEIYADQGVDGFVIVIDATANKRIKEVLDGTGIPYIAILNSVRDENGREIVPLIGMEGYTIGHMMTQWLYDNYKKYWGDIDSSKIGMLNYTFSPNIDFHERHLGNIEKFNELLPGNSDLIFPADGVSGGLNEQTGFDLASATFAAHPEVEYWFVPSCLELYAVAAGTAAENLGIEDRVLITTANSDVLSALWESGYDGCFKSCIATHALQYAAPALSGLVSLINGTSTFETLWSTIRKPTDLYTYYEMKVDILTIDNYQAFFSRVRAESGLG